MEEQIHSILLNLIRLGIWGKGEVGLNQVLPESVWEKIFRLARYHTVEAVVYDGIKILPKQLQPSAQLLLKWTVRVDQIERDNVRMNSALIEQIKMFRDEGIQPLLLKGQGMASMYPVPLHRICGDIDWAFQSKRDFVRANRLIKERKGNLHHTAGFSTAYTWNGVAVEHHQRVFDIHSPLSYPYLNKLKRKFKMECMELDFNGVLAKQPAPTLFILQINAHILKHLLSFGIGLRQLCDSAIAYHALKSKIDKSLLKATYKRLGIIRWIHVLHAVLVRHIGLPKESLPFSFPDGIEEAWLINEIQQMGNFGFHDVRFTTNHPTSVSRDKVLQRVISNFRKYFKYAPMEALSFPMVHFYSDLSNR